MAKSPEQLVTEPVEMTYPEMQAAFPGEWVLARITKWEDRDPLAGVIVAHDKSDDEVANHLPRKRNGRYWFFRSKRDPEGNRHVDYIIPTESPTGNLNLPTAVLTTRGLRFIR